MNRIVKIFATGFLSVLALTASAQNGEGDTKESLFNPVNYAVISQTIAPDARGGGLGDVGAATDPDVNSQYWNPAKYPFNISRAGVALNFTPWLRSLVNDMNLAYLSGYYRIGDYSAVSASLRYFNMGEVFLSDPGENENAMTINPYEMSIDVALSDAQREILPGGSHPLDLFRPALRLSGGKFASFGFCGGYRSLLSELCQHRTARVPVGYRSEHFEYRQQDYLQRPGVW